MFFCIPGTVDTPYMIFEYMMHGDLAELLRKNDPTVRKGEDTLILERVSANVWTEL